MINKRLFGTPITGIVKKKLTDRQRVAGQVAPGESIEAVFPDKDGNNQADLSSRTPFVRMWTSVKLIEPGYVGQTFQEITLEEFEDYTRYRAVPTQNNIPDIVKKVDKLKKDYPKTALKMVKDPNGVEVKGYGGKSLGKNKFYIAEEGANRDQVDYTEKTYVIGDYTYQEKYGSVSPNESLPDLQRQQEYDEKNWAYDDTTNVSGSSSLYEIFPSELEKNPLMKPQSGITKVSSETEGTLGVIKKTTIDFVVHNFYDYDRIFNKYFLKPGATIFVDFGWSSVKSLYNPEDLINHKKGVEHFLYSEGNQDGDDEIGVVTKNQGDLEVLQGIVTDYNSKVTQNGSVECSVTITSSNSSLLSFEVDEDISKRIKVLLERGILFLGVQEIIDGTSVGSDLKQLLNTPDYESEATDIQNYNNNLQLLAIKLLSSNNGKPMGNAVRTGVYLNNLSVDDNYISFGFFEDIIINSQFGFGKSEKDILEGKNSQVRMNSSNSYTVWNKKFSNAQKVMFRTPEEPPQFLYPDIWGKFGDGDNDGSFSYQQNKLPTFTEYDSKGNVSGVKSYENGKLTSKQDIELNRIPLREIFINVDIIINAFQQNDSVRKVIKQILDEVNEASNNIFNLELIKGDYESEIKVADQNYTKFDENDILVKKDKDVDDTFTFNVMNPNSIIKDYNLEFKLPTGNIGNMYAIQGMSHGDNIFSVKNSVLQAKDLNKVDKDSLSIIYNPDLGTYRLEQLLDTHNDSEVFNVYDQVNKLLSSNIYNISTDDSKYINLAKESGTSDLIEGDSPTQMFSSDAVEGTTKETEKKEITTSDLIKQNEESLELVGIKVAKTFREYYGYQISDEVTQTTPSLLPYNLSITTYGIGSVVPGDTFKVDYLPKMYIDNTYLQTTKVSHNVGTDGWYTTLDTQFRLKATETNTHEKPTEITLSANAILQLGLDKGLELDGGKFYGFTKRGDDVPIDRLLAYCTNFKILDTEYNNIDVMISFKTVNKLKDVLTNESGFESAVIKHKGVNLFGGLSARFNTKADFEKSLTYFDKLSASDFNNRRGVQLRNFRKTSYQQMGAMIEGMESSDNDDDYAWLIHFGDVELKPDNHYILIVYGNTFALFDPSILSTDKIQQYLQWWQVFGGLDERQSTLNEEMEEVLEKIKNPPRQAYEAAESMDASQEEINEYLEQFEEEDEPDFCFIKGTQIHMFDGSKKNIEDIKVGDEVLSMNNIKGIVTEHLIHPVNKNTMVAKVGNLIGEPHHPIFENNKWIEMKKSNNVIFERKYVDNYYNLEIDGNDVYGSEHTYIANNQIVSGLGDSEILNNIYQRQNIFKKEFV